jgi:hypothetical protein
MARNRRFQHGSLFKRGTRTKVWVARWWEDVSGREGKLERVRRSEILGTVAEIPTRRQADQVLSNRLRGINAGDFRPQSNCTFSEFVQRNWMPELLPTLKYSSKKHYEYIVNFHLIPAFGDMQLRLISRELIQSFLGGKLRSGLSWKTVKHIRTTFGTVLAAAEMQGLIPNNPARQTKLPRRGPVAEKTPIAPEKIRQLLEALPEPSRSLAWLLALTGLRIGELLQAEQENSTARCKRNRGVVGFRAAVHRSGSARVCNQARHAFQSKKSSQSSACADVREARHRGCHLALAAPCERDAARRGRHAVGNRCRPYWGTLSQRSHGRSICTQCQRMHASQWKRSRHF